MCKDGGAKSKHKAKKKANEKVLIQKYGAVKNILVSHLAVSEHGLLLTGDCKTR